MRQLLRRSSTTALQQRRARILLTVDGGGRHAPTDAAAAATQVDPRTVARVREAFAHGLERALNGQTPVFPPRRKLSDLQEAQVLVLAQAEPPPGHARWSLRLLANRLVELDVFDGISPETVRATLKKNDLQPWRMRPWATPPPHRAGFAAAMEDVLAVYVPGRSIRPGRWSAATSAALHLHPWLLAEPGRRVRRLGGRPQRLRHPHHLAIHPGGRPHPVGSCLPQGRTWHHC